MKTVLLPSGLTCRPRKLRGIYRGIREFRAYDEIYNVAKRISGHSHMSPDHLWTLNPYVVSSVVSSDLSLYNPKKHPIAS